MSASEDGDRVASARSTRCRAAPCRRARRSAARHYRRHPAVPLGARPRRLAGARVGLGGDGWSAVCSGCSPPPTDAPGSGSIDEDPRIDPDDQNGSIDVYQRQPDGTLTWISRDPRIPAGTPQTAAGEANASRYRGGPRCRPTAAPSSSSRSASCSTPTPAIPPTCPKLAGPLQVDRRPAHFIGARPDGSVPAAGSDSAGAGASLPATRSRATASASSGAPRAATAAPTTLYMQRDGRRRSR